jgi:hypothetical protein
MRKTRILILATSLVCLLAISLHADEISHLEAKEIVKNLPCSKGGTIDAYLSQKALVPAVDDLGWKTYPREDGFEIERLMLLMSNKIMKLSYKWHVSFDGKVHPISGKAMDLTP